MDSPSITEQTKRPCISTRHLPDPETAKGFVSDAHRRSRPTPTTKIPALPVGLLSAILTTNIAANPALPKAIQNQVDLDNITFASNERLRSAMEATTATPQQVQGSRAREYGGPPARARISARCRSVVPPHSLADLCIAAGGENCVAELI
jgi:hypothetical protein